MMYFLYDIVLTCIGEIFEAAIWCTTNILCGVTVVLHNLNPGRQCTKLPCKYTLAYYCNFLFIQGLGYVIFRGICLGYVVIICKFITLLKFFQFSQVSTTNQRGFSTSKWLPNGMVFFWIGAWKRGA